MPMPMPMQTGTIATEPGSRIGRIAARPAAWLVAGAVLVLGLATLAPVLVAKYPPLVDYPDHLARCFVLAHLHGDPVLRRFYRNAMDWQPNLALDLVIPPLAHVVSIFTAGRIFLGLTLASMAAGAFALHRVLHGRWSSWPLLVIPFLYNQIIVWGFLGYLLGLGAALGAAALWYALRESAWPIRLAAGLVAATSIYVLHLFALGIYAVLVGGFELADWLGTRRAMAARARRIAVLGLQFLPAAYLFLFVSPTSAAAGRLAWGPPLRRVIEIVKVLDTGHPLWDAAALAAVAGVVAGALLTRRARLAPAAIAPLVVLLALAVVMPNELFSSFGADRRIPIALALSGIAAADWDAAGPMVRRAVLIAVLGVSIVRLGAITASWAADQATYRTYAAALRSLPEGATLLASVPADAAHDPPLYHVDSYAVILRDAFTPGLFATPWDAGSSLGFTPRYAGLRAITPDVVVWPKALAGLANPAHAAAYGPFRPALLDRYDAALAIDPALLPAPARPPASCRAYAAGRTATSRFRLLRLPCAQG